MAGVGFVEIVLVLQFPEPLRQENANEAPKAARSVGPHRDHDTGIRSGQLYCINSRNQLHVKVEISNRERNALSARLLCDLVAFHMLYLIRTFIELQLRRLLHVSIINLTLSTSHMSGEVPYLRVCIVRLIRIASLAWVMRYLCNFFACGRTSPLPSHCHLFFISIV
jgi:hypothetical protein